MSDETAKPLFGFRFPLKGVLAFKKATLRRLCEITIEEMERDLASEKDI